MTTLLVLTKQASLSSAISAVLEPQKYQVITKDDVWEAESLLSRGAIDISIVDVEFTDIRAMRLLEELKKTAPHVPIVVYAGAKEWQWEEDAYVLGIEHILTKPVRGRLLNTLLDRLTGPVSHPEAGEKSPSTSRALRPTELASDQVRGLEALRNFSGILTHSLRPESLLKQFLLLLRQIIGVNRAMIFLRKPSAGWGEGAQNPDDRWMRCACAIGLEHTLLDHFALSLSTGVGGFLYRQGRILRAHGPEAQANREILKEFQLLGAEVAIPILDRESLIGVAVLDARLTGDPYANEELALIFHMLEEVGLAIKNSWLHTQLSANHEMLVDILSHLGSGCIVVGSNMAVLHANSAAQRILLPAGVDNKMLEFSDLPQELGSRVFAVMKTGIAVPPFKYQLPSSTTATFQVTISPFRLQSAEAANAALVLIEDITQLERSQKLEIEASNLRLVKAMAEHLAHEIGNSLVPLSTHQQLLEDRYDDEEFRSSLSKAMSEGVKRISRLANQMMFLARERTDFRDRITVHDLVQEAFREANNYHSGKASHLKVEEEDAITIAGDRKALRHALLEVLLNALQANPNRPDVAVRIAAEDDDGGTPHLNIEVQDSGSGFSGEAVVKASTPFFSTRNVGLGLGLTVTRKIIEEHRGSLEIAQPGTRGVVKISLPLSN